MMNRVILYIAASLDGYIAGVNDELDFLKSVEELNEDYGYNEFLSTVDFVVMGRRTYDKILTLAPDFPVDDKKYFILSKTERAPKANVTFYNGDVEQLIDSLKGDNNKHVFVDGGAEIVHLLLKKRLIDEIILSVIPVLLGAGIRLFKGGEPEQALQLLSADKYKKGLVQLHYKVIV